MLLFWVIIIVSYLSGSFPSALVIGRLFKKVDVRQHGSGNMGTTNVIRVLGFKYGMLVLFLDISKALVPVLVARTLACLYPGQLDWFYLAAASGLAAIAGHLWPIFAGFKGGKGVASATGVCLVLFPLPVGLAIAIFVLVLIASGYVSLASLVASLIMSPSYLLIGRTGSLASFPSDSADLAAFVLCLVLTLAVFVLHRKNIVRLVHGSESRFEKARLFNRLWQKLKRKPLEKG